MLLLLGAILAGSPLVLDNVHLDPHQSPSATSKQYSGWGKQCTGPLQIPGDSQPVYLVFAKTDAKGVRTSADGSILLGYNVRMYLSRSCEMTPDAYASWSLVGKSISFTVDLGNAGCG